MFTWLAIYCAWYLKDQHAYCWDGVWARYCDVKLPPSLLYWLHVKLTFTVPNSRCLYWSLDSDYSAMEATGSTWKRRWLECCYPSMPSPQPAACAGPVCVKHTRILQPGLTHSSCVHVCIFYICDFLWPEVQPHSDDSQMHVANCSNVLWVYLVRLAPQCISCIF